MSVVTKSSTPLANLDATPSVPANARSIGASLMSSVGSVKADAGDSIGSVYRFCRVPSNVCIRSVLLSCDALIAGSMDVGVYKTPANGGVVLNQTAFAAAVGLGAALVGLNITHLSSPSEDVEKPLWQVLGLAADPYGQFDIAGTLTLAITGPGKVWLRVDFVQ